MGGQREYLEKVSRLYEYILNTTLELGAFSSPPLPSVNDMSLNRLCLPQRRLLGDGGDAADDGLLPTARPVPRPSQRRRPVRCLPTIRRRVLLRVGARSRQGTSLLHPLRFVRHKNNNHLLASPFPPRVLATDTCRAWWRLLSSTTSELANSGTIPHEETFDDSLRPERERDRERVQHLYNMTTVRGGWWCVRWASGRWRSR
jgi:hypothetical protein